MPSMAWRMDIAKNNPNRWVIVYKPYQCVINSVKTQSQRLAVAIGTISAGQFEPLWQMSVASDSKPYLVTI